MIEIIQKLFADYGYKSEMEKSLFYATDDKKEFWFIHEWKENLLDNQIDLFNKCVESISDSALKKNISMLILWKLPNGISEGIRERIMLVEEDAFFFKKYVLYYSEEELKDFNSVLKSHDLIKEFIEKEVISRKNFVAYRNNSKKNSWQDLLYRMAIKIPFVKVNIKEKNDLQYLFDINQNSINLKKDHQLIKLHSLFLGYSEDKLDELCDKLLTGTWEENNEY